MAITLALERLENLLRANPESQEIYIKCSCVDFVDRHIRPQPELGPYICLDMSDIQGCLAMSKRNYINRLIERANALAHEMGINTPNIIIMCPFWTNINQPANAPGLAPQEIED